MTGTRLYNVQVACRSYTYEVMNDKDIRLSDNDRNDAINQLARAVGEGRLSMDEFEDRSNEVMHATLGKDLVPVLKDIPALRNEEIKEFSRADIDKLRADGRKTRAGIALISTLLGFSIGPVLIATGTTFAGIACLVAVPIIWVLLYVMKIGPDSWHTPSIRQLERQRKREIEAQRKDKWSQLSDEAFGIAQRQLSRWNKK